MKDIQDQHRTIPTIRFHPGHPDSKEEMSRGVGFESGWPGYSKDIQDRHGTYPRYAQDIMPAISECGLS